MQSKSMIFLNKTLSKQYCGVLIIIGCSFFSCKKFVTINPPVTQLVTKSVFTSDPTATSAMVGIYSQMMQSNGFTSGNFEAVNNLTGISSDELGNYTSDVFLTEFYKDALVTTNGLLYSSCWSEPYSYIYQANAVLEGMQQGIGISDAVKKQLSGEALFVRAYCNFYLVNLFGNVPLILSTAYADNTRAVRTAAAAVYQQIVSDLKMAQVNLSPDFSFSNGERVKPNKGAATALLARVYLFQQDWADAAIQASSLIENTSTYSLQTDLDSVFLANSHEAIWQLEPVQPGYNTNEGSLFILSTVPSYYALNPALIGAFETGDQRRSHWVDSLVVGSNAYYYPFKYKIAAGTPVTEYSMELRLAEQFLIRAEAEAQQNQLVTATADLNTIRSRVGLPNTTASDQASLLQAILQERRVELFTEGSHRWFDLKRSGSIDSVMNPAAIVKGGSWQSADQWYPIPQMEIQLDPMLTQNAGY
jgi:hypothetical protein